MPDLQNLQRVRNGRTVLMITHRFAPLKYADRVLLLEKGVLIEQGSHQELLQYQGAYWALHQQQQAAV